MDHNQVLELEEAFERAIADVLRKHYPIIMVTFGFVFVQAFRGKVPWLVALA